VHLAKSPDDPPARRARPAPDQNRDRKEAAIFTKVCPGSWTDVRTGDRRCPRPPRAEPGRRHPGLEAGNAPQGRTAVAQPRRAGAGKIRPHAPPSSPGVADGFQSSLRDSPWCCTRSTPSHEWLGYSHPVPAERQRRPAPVGKVPTLVVLIQNRARKEAATAAIGDQTRARRESANVGRSGSEPRP